ncbi:MAG: transporter substrate-binding domain-containing protein [Terasakiella sp.]|uniref:transporter substrate-binding domain-containing protein n=1 Tax=unclassified Terasakiella TaxID=2614952 RepID=UPI003AFFD869
MKQRYKHLILILFSLLLADIAHANEKNIHMACTHFPPYKIEAKDNTEPHRGIDLDIMRNVFEVTGDKVDFNFYPWKRSVEMVKRQQADGLCGCSYHPSRETDFLFSDSIGHHSQGIFINETSSINTITTLDQLKQLLTN